MEGTGYYYNVVKYNLQVGIPYNVTFQNKAFIVIISSATVAGDFSFSYKYIDNPGPSN